MSKRVRPTPAQSRRAIQAILDGLRNENVDPEQGARAMDAIERSSNEKSILTGLRRGFARRCPNCGVGRLFAGFLTIRSPCEVCGNDNNIYPSDDFPPYLAIFITGHVVIPLFIWTDAAFVPPFWLEAAIWLPLTAIMCTVLLPFMKGATVGLCWATNLVRREGSN